MVYKMTDSSTSKSTAELVHEAADALLKKGVRPSQQNIREHIGRGSATTIHKALNEWWQQLSVRLQHQASSDTSLPEPVLKLTEELWRQALLRADARLDEQRQQLQLQYREKQQQLLEKSDSARGRVDDLATSLAAAYARIDALQDELDSVRKENIIQEKQLIAAESKSVGLDRELRSQQAIHRELEARLARLSMNEADEAYELDRLRQENNQLKAVIERLDAQQAKSF